MPQMIDDLRVLSDVGVARTLLYNATCHGREAASCALAQRVHATVRAFTDACGAPEAVTTTSPAVAQVLRHSYPAIRVRAAIAMRIGSITAMSQIEDLFDDYCIQRDHQRDLARLRRLREWATAHGKRLTLLANSGCLRHCPTQGWHDNLVAHLDEACAADPLPAFEPLTCRRYLADPAHRQALLQATWIRPEDLHFYEPLVDSVKLATRSHPRPLQVIGAYYRRRHHGNLLDLLEPGLGHVLGNAILDNERLPSDWVAHTQTCPADGSCQRCAAILRQAVVTM